MQPTCRVLGCVRVPYCWSFVDLGWGPTKSRCGRPLYTRLPPLISVVGECLALAHHVCALLLHAQAFGRMASRLHDSSPRQIVQLPLGGEGV